MTEDIKNQDTQLVELAIQQTAALLTISGQADAEFIYRELFFNVWSKFREHQRRLSKLEIIPSPSGVDFFVKANELPPQVMRIKKKGGEDES